MARICIYCGKELSEGTKCSCRGNTQDTSKRSESSGQDRKKQKSSKSGQKREKAYQRQEYRAGTGQQSRSDGKQNFKEGFFRLLTSRGFGRNDRFPTKVGLSLFHSFFRPVTAAEAFVRNSDKGVSIFFAVIFALSFGLGIMRISTPDIQSFGEGVLFGAGVILLLNALTMITFRFLIKVRQSFMRFLAASSLSSFYMSLFILIASAGRVTTISFFMTIAAGLAAMVLTHFISLKALSGQPTERLLVNMILVYFILLMLTGLIASLAVPPAAISNII